jgi:hypothetical protein
LRRVGAQGHRHMSQYRPHIMEIIDAILDSRNYLVSTGMYKNIKRMNDQTFRMLEDIVMSELNVTEESEREKIRIILREIRNEFL